MTILRGNPATFLAVSAASGTLTWGTNPPAGSKVLVAIIGGASGTISSVVDNGTTPSTFTADVSKQITGHSPFVWIYRADNITLPASGSYQVSITGSGGSILEAGGLAYTGVKAGAPTATNTGTNAGSTAVSTGSVTPAAAGAVYFAVFQDLSGVNPETISLPGSGFTQQYVETNGASFQAGAVADKIDAAGPTSTACTWTLGDSVAWAAAVAVYDAATVAAFPSVILDEAVDLNLAGTWTPIKPYVYGERKKPQITRGRAPESPQPVAATFAAQLNNRDSRFSPHNPTGAYYPNIGRNTPLRVSVPGTGSRLRMEDDRVSYASCPSSSALNVSGDLELRIDVQLSDWTAQVLASKWNASASWAWMLNANGTMSFWVSGNGSGFTTSTSTQPLPWPAGRFSLKVTYAHSTGVITYYYATSIGGSYTQLGAAVTQATTGTLFAGTQPVQVGANSIFAGQPGYLGTLEAGQGVAWAPAQFSGLAGSVYEFQMYSGIAGTLVADPVFSSAADGTTALNDVQGNTWTLSGSAAISSRAYRFHGEVSEWPQVWDESGSDVYADVTASGYLRRLQQKAAPLGSAYTRAWQRVTGTYAPKAYWPCEDGNNSEVVTLGLVASSSANPTVIASGLAGAPPMLLSGGHKTQFASSSTTDFACTNSLPVPATDTWTGTVPKYTQPAGAAAIVVRFLLAVPAAGDVTQSVMCRVLTTGTVATLDLVYGSGSGGTFELNGYNAAGGSVFSSGFFVFGQNGNPCMIEMVLAYDGSSSYTYGFGELIVGQSSLLAESSVSYSATSLGVATQVIINPGGANLASAIGQISVQDQYANPDRVNSAFPIIGPLNGWAGETAALRFARVCGEQGFPCRITGPASQSVGLGPQTPQAFLQVLQECEDADHGVIYEPRSSLALAYRTSGSMAAQPYALTSPLALSYTAADLGGGEHMKIVPVDDDQLTVNDELVTRGSGSVTGSLFEATLTAAQYAATSALSIAAPPAGAGLYQDAQTINVFTDTMLGDQAAWLVHLGTVNEPRYTAIPVDLARSELAALINSVAGLDIGDYVTVTSPPSWLSPDAIRALCWGYTEVLGGYIWTIQWATRPASAYDVLIAGSGALTDCRADTDGSSLATSYTSGATSLSVATAAGNMPWTTAAGDVPFDIIVAGERMTVTNITTPGVTRGQVSNLTTSGGAAVSIPWGTNPTAGQKVIMTLWTGTTNIPTSVVDNGTTPSTFQLGVSKSDGSVWVGIYYADNITLPSVGAYAVTVNNPATHGMNGGGRAYSGVKPGPPTATSTGNATSTAVATGIATPGQPAALAVAAFIDNTGLTSESITLTGSGFSQIPGLIQVNGSAFFAGAAADNASGSGGQNGTWTLGDSIDWSAALAVWDLSQTFTVTRSVNGVVKAQASGAAVNLFQPCYFALA